MNKKKQEDMPKKDRTLSPSITHGGEDVPPQMDFFAPAPAQIGHVLSGYASLKKEDQPKFVNLLVRVAFFVMAVGIGIAVAFGINHFAEVSRDGMWYYLWYIILGGLGIFIGITNTSFKHPCSYVGEEGVAKFYLSKSRDKKTTFACPFCYQVMHDKKDIRRFNTN